MTAARGGGALPPTKISRSHGKSPATQLRSLKSKSKDSLDTPTCKIPRCFAPSHPPAPFRLYLPPSISPSAKTNLSPVSPRSPPIPPPVVVPVLLPPASPVRVVVTGDRILNLGKRALVAHLRMQKPQESESVKEKVEEMRYHISRVSRYGKGRYCT